MFRGLILFALLATSTALAQTLPGPLLMGPDSIGPVKRGWVQADVLVSGLPFVRRFEYTEGDPHTVYALKIDDHKSLEVWFFADGRPFSLSTRSTDFVTGEGAHVGLTLAELQAIYPGGTVFISGEEGLTFSFLPRGYIPGTPTTTFGFDPSAITDDCLEDRKSCANLGVNRSVSFAVTW